MWGRLPVALAFPRAEATGLRLATAHSSIKWTLQPKAHSGLCVWCQTGQAYVIHFALS